MLKPQIHLLSLRKQSYDFFHFRAMNIILFSRKQVKHNPEQLRTILREIEKHNMDFVVNEDLAAEQKARVTYDNILRLCDDPDVCDPIKYLRAREVVHYHRFGDALRIAQDHLDSRNFYAFNPSFDKNQKNNLIRRSGSQ